jgi:hypothetical protein
MKPTSQLRLIPTFLVFIILCSCGELTKTEQEKMPYFDLKGFVIMEAEKLEGSEVILISRVQGAENREDKILTQSQWLEQFDTFIQSDINKPSYYLSYDTKVKNNVLTHSLFEDENEKVKEIKITYIDDKVVSATLKSSEENLFYSTTTFAELYMNNLTQKVDHYSIETTQKIWFLKASNLKIMGAIKAQ